ncbi:winged helix-turn-helix transcriptional regulator [Desertivirga brevis]|uniref:winged helix-turn-helix transcriptional regulator n=1 Tax=Desertivirga brevis TaxID=2810310 RepID=UPI001A975CB9|nr:helix-turn-helix domain-containing protein [Pedobacter sp. SYSU D00873]
MYERKIKEDLDCGILIAMIVFGGKWKPCIIDAISKGFNRPSEIHRAIAEATPRVLDMQLRELLQLGVVRKETGGGFPLMSVYHLTPLGLTIIPVINEIGRWGNDYKEQLKERLSQAV